MRYFSHIVHKSNPFFLITLQKLSIKQFLILILIILLRVAERRSELIILRKRVVIERRLVAYIQSVLTNTVCKHGETFLLVRGVVSHPGLLVDVGV